MKKLLIVVSILFSGILFTAPSFASIIDFAAVADADVTFTGTGDTFQFIPNGSGVDFMVTDAAHAATVGFPGTITGTYTIGSITTTLISPGLTLYSAPVTGSGTISIVGGGGAFQGTVTWQDIYTFGSGGGLNSKAAANITGGTYGGTNPDLLALANPFGDIGTITFQFSTVTTLADLTANDTTTHTSYSGSLSPAVPIPASILLLAPGLLGLVGIRRRLKK